jgi:hypothetical protein
VPAPITTLADVSTRLKVETGDDAMIKVSLLLAPTISEL